MPAPPSPTGPDESADAVDAAAAAVPPPSLRRMVIGSVDTLLGRALPQDDIPPTWNEQPPLLDKVGLRNRVVPETPKLLKGMLRKGVPPPLRCAVWLSNVVQTVHPLQNATYWHEYRTLVKVQALDAAYQSVVDGISTDPDHWAAAAPPSFGREEPVRVLGTTERGCVAQTRLLVALERLLGLEGAAPLLPAVATLLLTHMPESYAFCAVREMLHEAAWYLPVGPREYVAWCRTFGDVMRKLHAATAAYLEDRGVFDLEHMAPMFQDLWIGILPLPHIFRIMDIYTLEGFKALFRINVALLVLYKLDAAEQLTVVSNAADWWAGMRAWAHSRRFDMELVLRKAYGLHGRGIRRQLRFPPRHILQRIFRVEAERAQVDEALSELEVPPVGLVLPDPKQVPFGEEVAQPVLAQPSAVRQHLAEWLPITLRMTNLDLLYSTNHHGRTLERFYHRVQKCKHTLLLCEAFPLGLQSPPVIVGMYASQAWRPSTKVYGDGSCFLFRLEPNARCWKWTPKATGSVHGNSLDAVDLENDDNQTALLEQFMVSTHAYISMGGNSDGSAGLRFNEDFTKGESSPAAGFENEPLVGLGHESVFEVGLVEVYRLVRQIDGGAV